MRIDFLRGDSTEHAVDAVVNAANHSLLGGGGVEGAIHRKDGPDILAECQRIKGIYHWPKGRRGPAGAGRSHLDTQSLGGNECRSGDHGAVR